MKSFILHSSLWLKHSAESSITPESKVEEPRLVRFPLRTGHNQATVQDSVYFNAVCLFCFHSFVSCGAMSSLVDSTAQFETQLRDTGLGAPPVTSLKAHGVRTLAQLAVTIGQPGQPIADASIETLMQAAAGRQL